MKYVIEKMLRGRYLVVIVLCLVLFPGCLISREMSDVRRDIEMEFPGLELTKDVEVTVNSGIFRTVGNVLGRVTDDRDVNEAVTYVREFKRVKVGVYKIDRFPLGTNPDLYELSRFDRDEWRLGTRVTDRDATIWVLFREWQDEVRDMFVLALNDDELVLIRLEGTLDALLDKSISDGLFVADVFGHSDRHRETGGR